MTPPVELTAAQLRRRFDPARFDFASTAEAPDLEGIIGQGRASARDRVRAGDPLPRVQRLRHGTHRRGQNEHYHPLPGGQRPRPGRCRRIGATHTISGAGPADRAPPASRRGQPAAGSGQHAPDAGCRDPGQGLRERSVRAESQCARPPAGPAALRAFPGAGCDREGAQLHPDARGGRVHVEPGQGRPDADARGV